MSIKIQNSIATMVMGLFSSNLNHDNKYWNIQFDEINMYMSTDIYVMPGVEINILMAFAETANENSSMLIVVKVFGEKKLFECSELDSIKWKEQMMESSFWVKHKIIDKYPALQSLLELKY